MAGLIRLHVLTACTRPWNLPQMAASMRKWGDVDYTWHIRFDYSETHVGGQSLKNEMLDDISDGWVMFLDDDTVAHGKLYRKLEVVAALNVGALVVSQRRPDREDLRAAPENVQVGEIDIGQAVLRREAIGTHRIPESYAGDGEFLTEILPKVEVVYLPEVLSYYNALNV